IYFTLSEASTDFALDDVSVTGGQLSNFAPVASSGSPATGYTQYQVTFTPAANSSGLAAVGVVAGTFHDAAGNANKDTFESGVSGTVQEANNAVSFNVNTVLPDNTAPTVAVGRSGTGIVTGPETITFTLSEASTTFGAEDISVTGGTLSGFTPVATSGSAATGYTEYTATFTPAVGTSGSATVGVASDKFSDAAGNYNKDTFLAGVAGTTQEVNNSVSFNYNSVAPDTTPPTIAIERLGTGTLSANASETIRFTISEATKDFTLDDIVVLDASGNVITGALSNLAAVPTSGTVGTGYTTYVATFTALSSITPASGMVTIGVASTKFSDAAGYFNQDTYTNPATGTDVYEANNKVDISYNTLTPSNDTITPTVIVARAGSATLQTGGTETITFTLSEPSLTFDWSDITVTGGGTLGPLTMVTSSGTPATGYTVYTATYTPPANTNSTTTIGVLSDKFSDAAGNLNKDTYATGVAGTSFETNNVVSVAYNTTAADTTAPKVEVLRSASGTITGPETIYFNFSEAINPASFTTSDIVATGGTISNLVAVTGSNNTQFIATFTPNATSTGTATIGVGASAVTDVAGNANTDTITFTLSEASADFTQTDVTVTGGTLSNWTHSTTNPLVYTATFTPTPNNAGTALIGVRAGTFNDLGNNANADDYRLTGGTNGNAENDNNKVDIAFNTLGATFVVNNDTNTVNEDGSAVTGNVKTNDSLVANVTSVSQGSTSGTLGTALAGTYGSLTLNADGSYTYVIDNSKTAVQALKAGQTVTEVFSYTGSNTGATQSGSANLTITITGTNDAPVAVADTATALEAGGTANGTAGSNATGNVLTNDTDLDLADTKVVSAIHAGSATGTTGDSAVAAGTPTVKAGTYGSISINADGSYTYTITDQNNSDIQALRTSGQSVNDVFTYTVKDGSNATHQATITVNITGANDAPTVSTTVANKNGTVGTALADFVGPVFADVDTVANGETSTITATLANGQPLSSIGLSYDASTNTFSGTPTAAGTYTIVVKDTDAGGLSVQTTFDVVVAAAGTPDTTPPTIAITSDKTTLAAGQSATITFTLSEASTDFAWDEASQTGDITVTGGTLTNFQGSGTSYSATFTPDANSIADSVIHVASNKFSDAAATPNFNVDGADANNTVTMVTNTMPADTTAPTIVVARTNDGATLNTGATETITFTLSEASTDFTLDDITVSGGQLSNFAPVPTSGTAGTGYTQYVVTFTPTANSTTPGTVGVLSGKFSDNAGNLNQDTYVTSPTSPIFNDGNNQVTLTIDTTTANPVPDTTVPTVAVARAGSGSLATGGTDTITFTLSEASTTFTVDDVDVVGGSLSNFAPVVTTGSAAGGYTVYTATFTPTTGSGTATIGVVDGKFADAAGNTNKDTYAASPTAPIVNDGNNQVSIGYDTTAADTTAPTVVVSRAGTGTVSTSETVYFTLSEASTTFALGDVTVNGGTLSNFVPVLTSGSASAGYTQYTATFTPVTGSGTAFVGVASGTFSDTATTPNTNKDTYDVDATSPLVYEANNFVDLAYNTSATDSTKPTIAITSDKTTLTAGQTALITFTLSEASTNFVEGDVTVTGGTLSGWIAISPTEYIATFTPATNSTANSVIHVDSDKFSDAASNQNADGAEANNTVTMATDTTSAPVTDNPTIAITSSTSTLANGQTATITFTLSEASSDFTSADIDVVGGTLGALQTTDNITYTATFTPTDNAVTTATIGVKAGKFTATATTLANLDTYEPFVTGTVAELNNIVSMAVNTDNTPPTVAVSLLTSRVTGPTTVTFTLSEACSDFTAAEVYVTPGAGSVDKCTKVSDTVYTARFNPTANSSGSVIIGVAAGTFKDAAGNNNADTYIAGTGYEANNKTDFTYNTDVTPPTIAITGPGGAINGPTTITFTLSEASSDFLLSEGDITVTGGGTLTNFAQSAGNPLVYTATYTPPATTTGAATINVASGAFSDAAGNFNADGG
ncbi:Ig-like domain-containing protein, partial [Limnohabitans sp.]|uniref:Ig-like domain-containing protein n=1 Tax=Limnohabitans sp. TaxID=1907725 RepID=UPI00311FAA90